MAEQKRRDFKNIAAEWDESHKYLPAPRHRRRLILGILRKINYHSILDVGCAQPYLLIELKKQHKQIFGADISDEVIRQNRKKMHQACFAVLDVSKKTFPKNKKFDLVIASEVLEHIPDWKSAVANLSSMSKKYLLITVPAGKRRKTDRMLGHLRHFKGQELFSEIEKQDFSVVIVRRWGFPFHTLYKYLANQVAPESLYDSFQRQKFGIIKKSIAALLTILFYANDLFPCGEELMVLAKRNQ